MAHALLTARQVLGILDAVCPGRLQGQGLEEHLGNTQEHAGGGGHGGGGAGGSTLQVSELSGLYYSTNCVQDSINHGRRSKAAVQT